MINACIILFEMISFLCLYLDMICGCFFGNDMNFGQIWTLMCYICDMVIFLIHVVILVIQAVIL